MDRLPCTSQKVTNPVVSSGKEDVFFDCQEDILDEPIGLKSHCTMDSNADTKEVRNISIISASQDRAPRQVPTRNSNISSTPSDSNLNEDELSVQMQHLTVTPDNDSTATCQTHVEIEDTKEMGTEKVVARNTAEFNPLLLQIKDCFFNWNLETNPLSYEEAGIIVSKENAETSVSSRLLQHLKWRPLATISQHLTLAFCHFVRMDVTEGERELIIISSLIQAASKNRDLPPDHLKGMNQVFCGLVALKKSLIMLKLDDEDRIIEEMELKKYITMITSANQPALFSDSAKAAIKFVKSFFLGARRIRDTQLQVVKEMVAVETHNVECWTYLNICYRLDRKAADYRAGPSVDEERTLLHAWRIDKNHPLVKLALVIYLTDMLKARKVNFQKHGWVVLLEVKTYYSMDDVVSDIRNICTNILEVEGMKDCVRTNVCIADIFMSGLPYNFRDDNMAKQCLEAATKLNANCSSASHKLGLLKLKMGCPLDAALFYVRQAYLVDQRNFPALIDTIQLLLSNPRDKQKLEELIALFSKNVARDKWPVKQSASVHVAQGFFLIMIGELQGAILAFTIAHMLSSEIVKDNLQKLPFLTQRYHWDPALLSRQRIRDFIQNEILGKYPVDGEDNPFDMEICSNLKKYLDESLQTQRPHDAHRGRNDHEGYEGSHAAKGAQRGSSAFRSRGSGRGIPFGRGGGAYPNVPRNPTPENNRGNFRGRGGRRGGAPSSNNRGQNYEFKYFK